MIMTREFNWIYDEELHVLDILQNGKLVLSIPRSTLVTIVDITLRILKKYSITQWKQ